MPLACIFTRTWLGPGWGCGTSFTSQERLTAGTTAACIFVSSMAIRCGNGQNGLSIRPAVHIRRTEDSLSHKPPGHEFHVARTAREIVRTIQKMQKCTTPQRM